MVEAIPTCPRCGSVLCREMGTFFRCVTCRRLFALSGQYVEPMGSGEDLSGLDDWKAEQAFQRRGAWA